MAKRWHALHRRKERAEGNHRSRAWRVNHWNITGFIYDDSDMDMGNYYEDFYDGDPFDDGDWEVDDDEPETWNY